MSGYHTLPNEDCYWSTAPDLRCEADRTTMPRKRFGILKIYFHFADKCLNKDDKYAKIRPLYDELNRQLVQLTSLWFHTTEIIAAKCS